MLAQRMLQEERDVTGRTRQSAGALPPLPKRGKVHYASLTDKQLRQLCTENHLGTGKRELMIRRHREFMLLYQSQSDAIVPTMTVKQMATEVLRQERLKESVARAPSCTLMKDSSLSEGRSGGEGDVDSDFLFLSSLRQCLM